MLTDRLWNVLPILFLLVSFLIVATTILWSLFTFSDGITLVSIRFLIALRRFTSPVSTILLLK